MLNRIVKLENGNYQLETTSGNVYPCSRWFEKKTDSWHVKISKEGSEECGRTYVRESKIVNGVYEFETKTEHREGLSGGGWRSRMTEEEKRLVEEAEKTIERIKSECMKRETPKVEKNTEEWYLQEIERLQKKLLLKKLERENHENPGLFDTDRDIDEIVEENPGILN